MNQVRASTINAGELMMEDGSARREVTRLIRHHWNYRAARFDEDPEHGLHSEAQRAAWLQLLSRLAGDTPRRVLDAGCGTGVLATLFAELGHTVTGVDLAPLMIERARQKAKDAGVVVQYRLENVDKLSDLDGSYDLVVARHVVWTLPDPAGTVKEWLRVLRPGGCLAIIEGQWAANRPAAVIPLPRRVLARFRRLPDRLLYYAMRPSQWSHLLDRFRASLRRGVGGIVACAAQPAEWKAALSRYRERKYAETHTQLPLYGGPLADQITALLAAQGLRDVRIEPLMDAALWGEAEMFQRYLATGKR